MNRHLLTIAITCLALLPCSARQQATVPPSTSPVSVDVSLSSLADVLAVYRELRGLALLEQEGKLTAAHIRQATGNIKGPLFTLRLLAPEYRENLIMLADAVLWQGQWMLAAYAGECGIEYEAPLLEEGLETIILLCSEASRILADDKAAPARRQAVEELVNELGGPDSLKLPEQWLQKRWAKDYKTALNFLTSICAAAAYESDKASLAALQKQRATLQYFKQGGTWEILRVNALAEQFHLALVEIGADAHSFGNPILPEKRRSSARMQALTPFFDILPQLKILLLKPQTNEQP